MRMVSATVGDGTERTGGGSRSAARAVAVALSRAWPSSACASDFCWSSPSCSTSCRISRAPSTSPISWYAFARSSLVAASCHWPSSTDGVGSSNVGALADRTTGRACRARAPPPAAPNCAGERRPRLRLRLGARLATARACRRRRDGNRGRTSRAASAAVDARRQVARCLREARRRAASAAPAAARRADAFAPRRAVVARSRPPASSSFARARLPRRARMSAGDFAACDGSGAIEMSPSAERRARRAVGERRPARRLRRRCDGLRAAQPRRGGAPSFGEHRVGRIELAAERDRLLPDFALAVADGEELGRDRLERRRLVVLRVDLEQLEVDLLPLRILLQRILQDLLGLRVAAVREVDLGLGDRIDLVGVDVAETLAAEVARERVVAGIDDAAAGRPEHGVGLDVGARDDAVLELRRPCAGARRSSRRCRPGLPAPRHRSPNSEPTTAGRRRSPVARLSAPGRPSAAPWARWHPRAAAWPPERLRPWVPAPGPAVSPVR